MNYLVWAKYSDGFWRWKRFDYSKQYDRRLIDEYINSLSEIIIACSLLLNIAHGSILAKAVQPNLCNGRDGIFIKNEKGCEFFFYCHHGQPLEAFCPGTFWFNEDSGICEEQKNVFCTLNDPVIPPVRPPVPDDLDEPVTCPAIDTNSITFIASQIDCSRYYICYHGVPIRQQCITEMHWNAATKRCDYPEYAKCLVNIIDNLLTLR